MKINVIIPMYNVEKYIEKCLDSVQKQTFDDFEVIIVDDGCTDLSVSNAKRCLEGMRYQIIHKKNAGLPQARMTGLEHATAEYIFFLDADDWIEPDTLQTLYDLIVKEQADIVCCNILLEDTEGNCLETLKAKKNGCYETEDAIRAVHEVTGIYTYMWNKLFRTEILKPKYFPTGHFIGEDYCSLFAVLLDNPLKIVHNDKALYHYVQHGNNMTKAGYGESFRLSYERFHDMEQRILSKYPTLTKPVKNYILVQDMAILNSMMRNGNYNEQFMKDIIQSIRKNLMNFLFCSNVKLLYKGSAFVIAINWKLYRIVYLCLLKRTS